MIRKTARLLSREVLSKGAVLLRFENVLDSWKSGQFVMLELICPGDDFKTRRAYSIANYCNTAKYIELLIEQSGEMPKISRLAQEWPVGFELLIEGPYGNFVLRDGAERVVLIASGSGIAPIRAMVQEVCYSGREVVLIFSSKTKERLYLIDELLALDDMQDNLTVHFFTTREERKQEERQEKHHIGRITKEKLNELLGDVTKSRFYLCGSPAFVRAMMNHLREMGAGIDKLHREQW